MRVDPVPARGAKLASTTRRVIMRDVDAAGILYFAAPYAWHEEMWTGVLFDAGHGLSSLLADGVGGPTIASAATYSAPVGLDAILQCELYALDVSQRSFGLRMEGSLPDGRAAVTVTTRHVWCRIHEGRLQPAQLPEWLRRLLATQSA
jgi:acyl-CoA thioesterase FadM